MRKGGGANNLSEQIDSKSTENRQKNKMTRTWQEMLKTVLAKSENMMMMIRRKLLSNNIIITLV